MAGTSICDCTRALGTAACCHPALPPAPHSTSVQEVPAAGTHAEPPWEELEGARASPGQGAQPGCAEVASGAELRGEGEQAEEGLKLPCRWGQTPCSSLPLTLPVGTRCPWKRYLLEDGVSCSQRPAACDTEEKYKLPSGTTAESAGR